MDTNTLVNIGLYVSYALIAVCVLGIIIFAVTRLAKDPKSAKSFLIGLLALGVLVAISYFAANGSDANTTYAKLEVSEQASKSVGMGLILFYILMGVAVIAILFSEVARLFKR